MAKKPAPKKKASTAKPAKKVEKKVAAKPATKVSAKASKPVAKVVKSVKPAVKAPPAAVKAKKTETQKPALMTKKGKAVQAEEIEETKAAPVKTQTVVSMLESDAQSEDVAKAEKVSKVKPVKIERGNAADEKAKWAELNKKYGKEKAVSYKMSEKFETMIPLQHKVLGWGFILTNENDRLEVLFETGIRMLISNYKST